MQFAKLISVTVILAFLWSVAFFLCALLAFGPEGTSGDVHLWAAHLIKRAKMRHSSAGARRGRGGEGEDEERGEGAR